MAQDGADPTFQLKQFRDTTFNGVSLKFKELSDTEYNSLKAKIIETEIPLQSASHLYSKPDSCFLFGLENGKTDSLCNHRQGYYFEEYQIHGYWKEMSSVLSSYSDWEGGNDFFIDLKNGGHYYLSHNYKLSPDSRFIFSFVDLNELVFVPSELLLTECGGGTIKTKLKIDLGDLVITDLIWVTKDQCIISTGVFDIKKFSVNDEHTFMLSIKF